MARVLVVVGSYVDDVNDREHAPVVRMELVLR
jgi:hypothetical protein